MLLDICRWIDVSLLLEKGRRLVRKIYQKFPTFGQLKQFVDKPSISINATWTFNSTCFFLTYELSVCQCCRLSFGMTADALLSLRLVDLWKGAAQLNAKTIITIHRILLNITRFWFAFDDINCSTESRVRKSVSFEIMTDFGSINHAHCEYALTESCRLCYISVVAVLLFFVFLLLSLISRISFVCAIIAFTPFYKLCHWPFV